MNALPLTALTSAEPEVALLSQPPVPAMSVARRVLGGTSALAAGIFLERGAGFAANILAARLAGAPAFGAYSLAISTANNISTYAAGGIGATAARFSGKYPYGSPAYSRLAQVLILVSSVSAILAASALWFGASPIAILLHKPAFSGLLRIAAISAFGIILLECSRGFFVGQRRLAAVLVLSGIVGVGMLLLLPWSASFHNASRMILMQGIVTIGAVACCLIFSGPLHLRAQQVERSHGAEVAVAPMIREVWSFGFVQLAGLVGANLAGWWLTALVARSDTTLVQMSFFAISSQLRNLAGLAPSLLTEGSYSVMADPEHEHLRTPQRVMAVCTFASTSASLLLAVAAIVVVPWVLPKLYGGGYRGATLTAAIGLGVAVVHMGNAPAAARLTIVSIRAAGLINTAWAVVVAAAGTVLLLHGGSAAMAMAIFLAAHVLSAALVLAVLAGKDRLPDGMGSLFFLSTLSTGVILALAWLRDSYVSAAPALVVTMLCAFFLMLGSLVLIGKRHGWLPSAGAITRAKHGIRSALARFLRTKKEPSHVG